MGQLMDHTSTMGQARMFSREWYNEYFRRADASPTHSRYCEQVYGRDLCQHGMMDTEEMAFLASLLRPCERVLEVGCSNGRITEYLQQHSGCSIQGLDYSDVAISQARERTRDNPALSFDCIDLSCDDIPGGPYDTILSIDTIYFMGDYGATLSKLNATLAPGGRIIVAAFQAKEADDPESILDPHRTRMGEVLNQLAFSYRHHDFTANIRNHWLKNYHLALALQPEFTREGNEFLFAARMAENGWFKGHGDAGTLVRYLYEVDRKSL
ncbi:MAG: class I SAM-dependent methyltransferase [Methylococcaceae bacterium]|nr:class I SAM-dependent methyltransferase [Methylococcaceae bacterium]